MRKGQMKYKNFHHSKLYFIVMKELILYIKITKKRIAPQEVLYNCYQHYIKLLRLLRCRPRVLKGFQNCLKIYFYV